MRVIGLTGGIASGKSTVSNYLMHKGLKIIDADKIAREIVSVGSEGLTAIADSFGDDIILEDGSLDRKKLGSIVFSDPDKLKMLNGITHPLINKKIIEYFEHFKDMGEEVIIFDCPLLFEGGYQSMCDETWLVAVEKDLQIERIILRDSISKEEALNIINSQMGIEEKKKLADRIIENNTDVLKLYDKIESILSEVI